MLEQGRHRGGRVVRVYMELKSDLERIVRVGGLARYVDNMGDIRRAADIPGRIAVSME